MKTSLIGIEASLAWILLHSFTEDGYSTQTVMNETFGYAPRYPDTEGVFEEPAAEDYGGMLERMEAEELLCLIERAKDRLQELERNCVERDTDECNVDTACVKLYIDKRYSIRINAPDGPEMMLRPLVKALFILFMKHPEGILLKRRVEYREELEEIYGTIAPGVSRDDVIKRVGRLVCVEDNSFSEKASVLNASLGRMLPESIVDGYKIQGHNGFPRKIPLASVVAVWV